MSTVTRNTQADTHPQVRALWPAGERALAASRDSALIRDQRQLLLTGWELIAVVLRGGETIVEL